MTETALGYLVGLVSGATLGIVGTFLVTKGDWLTASVIFGAIFFVAGFAYAEAFR
jgi:hypothetical protein